MKLNPLTAAALALAASIVITSQSATAHDMWLEKAGQGYTMAYGHSGKTDPYPPEKKAVYAKGFTANAWEVPLELIMEKDYARFMVDGDLAMVAGAFDNLYWLNTEDGWKNFDTPQPFGTATEAGHAIKFTKHIIKWAPFMAKPVGERAEIVPMTDPTQLKQGDILPIMIYLEGKPIPAQGTRLALSSDFSVAHPEMVDIKPGDMPVNIKIGPPGKQLVSVKHEHSLDGIDNIWYAFTLTFNTTE